MSSISSTTNSFPFRPIVDPIGEGSLGELGGLVFQYLDAEDSNLFSEMKSLFDESVKNNEMINPYLVKRSKEFFSQKWSKEVPPLLRGRFESFREKIFSALPKEYNDLRSNREGSLDTSDLQTRELREEIVQQRINQEIRSRINESHQMASKELFPTTAEIYNKTIPTREQPFTLTINQTAISIDCDEIVVRETPLPGEESTFEENSELHFPIDDDGDPIEIRITHRGVTIERDRTYLCDIGKNSNYLRATITHMMGFIDPIKGRSFGIPIEDFLVSLQISDFGVRGKIETLQEQNFFQELQIALSKTIISGQDSTSVLAGELWLKTFSYIKDRYLLKLDPFANPFQWIDHHTFFLKRLSDLPSSSKEFVYFLELLTHFYPDSFKERLLDTQGQIEMLFFPFLYLALEKKSEILLDWVKESLGSISSLTGGDFEYLFEENDKLVAVSHLSDLLLKTERLFPEKILEIYRLPLGNSTLWEEVQNSEQSSLAAKCLIGSAHAMKKEEILELLQEIDFGKVRKEMLFFSMMFFGNAILASIYDLFYGDSSSHNFVEKIKSLKNVLNAVASNSILDLFSISICTLLGLALSPAVLAMQIALMVALLIGSLVVIPALFVGGLALVILSRIGELLTRIIESLQDFIHQNT